MNKRIFAIILCCILLLLCGCDSTTKKYKRISFESDTLGDEIKTIDENAVVVNNADETFSSQISTYEIKERNISYQECKQMMEDLGLSESPYEFEHDGNKISISLAGMLDTSRGFYKIPFIEGEYEYYGIRGQDAIEDSDGKHISRVLVSFYPVLDGARVIGDNRCDMWFDGSGLVEIRIRMYDFHKTGTMDILPLADAEERIKTPDDLSIDDAVRTVNTLQVDRVNLLLINQYSR